MSAIVGGLVGLLVWARADGADAESQCRAPRGFFAKGTEPRVACASAWDRSGASMTSDRPGGF